MSDCKRCGELRSALTMARNQVDRMQRQLREFEAMKRERDFARYQADAAKGEAVRQRDRAQDVAAELAKMVIEHGVMHLAHCPEDDTCTCPHVERINRLLNDYPEATR